jgi:hypothetical protein
MYAAEQKLTRARTSGDAHAIEIADNELKEATRYARNNEAYEVSSHTNPDYDPEDEDMIRIKYDIASARSGGHPLTSYIEELQSAYNKGKLSRGLSELVKNAIAKQTKETKGGRRYKSKKYKRTSKKHKRTSKRHK